MSDQKPGSALFYNLTTSSASNSFSQNTRISLTNTHPELAAMARLFFVDGATCSVADSYVCLTPNQPVMTEDRQSCSFGRPRRDTFLQLSSGIAPSHCRDTIERAIENNIQEFDDLK